MGHMGVGKECLGGPGWIYFFFRGRNSTIKGFLKPAFLLIKMGVLQAVFSS